MGHWRTMYESNTAYLSAADLGDDGLVTLTIAEVREQRIESENGKQRRPVIHWTESVRPMIVNKTNILLIEALYGSDPAQAIGKRITIRWDPDVQRSGETVGGLRIAGAPGIKSRTVKIKHPQKRPESFRLENTAPKPAPAPTPAPAASTPTDPGAVDRSISAWLAEREIGADQLDKWLVSVGKSPLDDMHPSEAARLLDALPKVEGAIRGA